MVFLNGGVLPHQRSRRLGHFFRHHSGLRRIITKAFSSTRSGEGPVVRRQGSRDRSVQQEIPFDALRLLRADSSLRLKNGSAQDDAPIRIWTFASVATCLRGEKQKS